MKKLKEYKFIIIIALILILGVFYWYEMRPAQIEKICWNKIQKIKNGEIKSEKFDPNEFLSKYDNKEAIEILFNDCLKERGLYK